MRVRYLWEIYTVHIEARIGKDVKITECVVAENIDQVLEYLDSKLILEEVEIEAIVRRRPVEALLPLAEHVEYAGPHEKASEAFERIWDAEVKEGLMRESDWKLSHKAYFWHGWEEARK